MENSRVLICEGRKAGIVLSYGNIPSPKCFLHECPSQSFKQPRQVGNLMLIPDGWKMAVNVRGFVFVGEIRYNSDFVAQYQFSRYDGAALLECSEFCSAPTPAFTQVLSTLGKTGERPNGKLLLGVQYGEPQRVMREFFKYQPPSVAPEAKELFNQWMFMKTEEEVYSKLLHPFLTRKRASLISNDEDDISISPLTKKGCDENWTEDMEIDNEGVEQAMQLFEQCDACDEFLHSDSEMLIE